MRKLIVNAFLVGLMAASTAPAAVADEQNGSVEGGVRFAGPVPPAPEIQKPPACGTTPIHDQSYVVGVNDGLANVVVYLVGVKAAGPAAKHDLKLSQKSCEFVPHVQATTVGSKLVVTNGDATLHTAHGFHGAETMFNMATPPGAGPSMPQTLTQTGPIHIACDVGHTWMSAWIYVFDQPYFAVSDANGKFALGDVPPGEYTLRAWHEKLGERSVKVTVRPGEKTTATIDFGGHSAPTARTAKKAAP